MCGTAEKYSMNSSTKRWMHRETAVLAMSDMHFGRENTKQFDNRLSHISERLAAVRDILSSYDFEELVICMLGDMVDGSGIYGTQPHDQEISDAREQVDGLSRRLQSWLIEQQESIWGKIRVECVAGNHGRGSKFAAATENWDIALYDRLRKDLDGKISINYSTRDPFLRKIQANKWHNILLYHGHGMQARTTVDGRIRNWATSQLSPFSIVMMGHLHTMEYWRLNSIHFMRTGTMLVNDDYARSKGYDSTNEWWIFGCDKKRAVTWRFGLDLTPSGK